MKYIHKGKIVENNQPFDEIVRSYLLEENAFAYVILTDAMLDYLERNISASIEDIFYLKEISETAQINNTQ